MIAGAQMNLIPSSTVFIATLVLIGCGGGSASNPEPTPIAPINPPTTVSYEFNEDLSDFEVNSADHRVEHITNDKIEIELSTLPEPFEYRQGLKFKWENYSDDMKGFIVRKFDEFEVGEEYEVTFEVDLVTYISYECGGIGGSPSESVVIKGAILNYKPERSVQGDPFEYYRVNVQDSQNGRSEGDEVVFIGDIGLPTACVLDPELWIWESKTISNEEKFYFNYIEDNQGGPWLYISMDSGFEGVTEVYYTGLRVIYKKL